MKEQKEPLLFCRVMYACSGIKKPKFNGQKVKYRNYAVGEKIKGYANNASDVPTSYIPTIKTIDGFVINSSNLMVIGEEHSAEVIDDKDAPISERVKKRFQRFANVSGASEIVANKRKQTQYMLNGALTGGVIMFTYALTKGSSKSGYFIFGAIVGGMIGKYYGGQKDE